MVSKDKDRIMVTISKEERRYIEEVAERERRSISNMVGKIIKEWVGNGV